MRIRHLFIFLLTVLTMNAQPRIARELFDSYDDVRLNDITHRRFTQAQLRGWLQPFVDRQVVAAETLGMSGEGRPITLYSFGTGPVRVLLWSQMHGDEPTATMALVDIFRFFAAQPEHIITRTLRERLTILVIPMLNPDGAERFTRRTGQLIDMNRDALALETPEARILKETRDKFQPAFGFNLHDQDTRYTVGTTKKITAIALLAPALDEARTDPPVRKRAKHLAATLADVMRQFIPGNLAKWDDTFEPRAFGDNIQKWGTSTVLIESGGWANDPEKMFLRKLNYVGILTALHAIATGAYEEADTQLYEKIPFNMKYAFDLLIRNARLQKSPGAPAVRVDIGVNYEESAGPDGTIHRSARIMDVGDLSTFTAYEERDASGRAAEPALTGIERAVTLEELERLLRP